jgi:hypothetical protein
MWLLLNISADLKSLMPCNILVRARAKRGAPPASASTPQPPYPSPPLRRRAQGAPEDVAAHHSGCGRGGGCAGAARRGGASLLLCGGCAMRVRGVGGGLRASDATRRRCYCCYCCCLFCRHPLGWGRRRSGFHRWGRGWSLGWRYSGGRGGAGWRNGRSGDGRRRGRERSQAFTRSR